MTSSMPKVGAVPLDESRTRFTVWAPLQESILLHLPDDDRLQAMSADAPGYHTLIAEAPVGTAYQFQFADGRRRPDPASLAQPQGVHGPSRVMAIGPPDDPASFRNPPLSQHVLYELHVGTFTLEGTFDAIIPRLPALASLGITAIELMPIAQFPGDRNWGYDGVGPFAAQWSYGGLAGLRRLVRACHQSGLAVLLDVVYNHVGPEGNYLAEFGPYFTDRYKTPWGTAINFDGPGSDHVREFFIQSSLLWTRDCGIDGLRLDAVHAIMDHTASTFLEELTARNHEEAERRGRRVLIIAESSDNDPRLLRPRARGGLGLDGCWNDDYHHAIRAAITGDRRGYYRDFGDPSQIAKAVRDRFVFVGEPSKSHGRRHGAPSRDIDHASLIVFSQNHDQVGNRPAGDRLDQTARRDGARVAAALVVLSPFTPMLWMGEEHAESAPFQYFVSHTDAALIEAVRRGRAQEFADFQGPGGVPDPQDEGTFRRSKLAWDLRETGPHGEMLGFYSELLRLRRALDIPGRARGAEAHALGPVIELRYGPAPHIVLVANTGAQPAEALRPHAAKEPSAGFEVLLDSTDPRWGGGTAAARPQRLGPGPTTLSPRSVLILRELLENE